MRNLRTLTLAGTGSALAAVVALSSRDGVTKVLNPEAIMGFVESLSAPGSQ